MFPQQKRKGSENRGRISVQLAVANDPLTPRSWNLCFFSSLLFHADRGPLTLVKRPVEELFS